MTVAGQTITDERLSDEALADMLATAERDVEVGVKTAVFPSDHIRLSLTELQQRRAEGAYVSVREMKVSQRPDGSTADFFVSIKVGDREVTPHVFRERFKAEYHVALYDWLLNGGDEPELMAFREDEWPARKLGPELAASPSSPSSGVRVKALEWRELTDDRGDGTREPNGDWEAETALSIYQVEMIPVGDTLTVWGLTYGIGHAYIGGDHASPDEAKAAAQADYEARIRSALDAT